MIAVSTPEPLTAHVQACLLCGTRARLTSGALAVCLGCIREGDGEEVDPGLEAVHTISRARFGLPIRPPRHPDGVLCPLCALECRIADGMRGFCGLRTAVDGRLTHLAGTPRKGMLSWCRDPLPTNCVAEWVCEGNRHSGCHNLAVFYESCTANCLYCQNWHYRVKSPLLRASTTAGELADAAQDDTFCACFFGGDPSSQMPHALAASKLLEARGVRICWETNGMMHPKHMRVALGYSMRTGGCIKFDLKAYDDRLHRALAGVSNRRTLENFAAAGERHRERPDLPLVVASTLLVPGYVDPEEVRAIASFIASVNPEIPYALLGFAPNLFMSDLPYTSEQHAEQAQQAALDAGLTNVRVGNHSLLGAGRQ